jgi:RHS repeat-associated protein
VDASNGAIAQRFDYDELGRFTDDTSPGFQRSLRSTSRGTERARPRGAGLESRKGASFDFTLVLDHPSRQQAREDAAVLAPTSGAAGVWGPRRAQRSEHAGRASTSTSRGSPTIGGAVTGYDYIYDTRGRLTDVKKSGVLVSHYDYDPNGNRLAGPTSGAIGTYDAQDRLKTYNGATYTYGANGELKTKTVGSAITTYTYDVLGNLTSVALPGGSTTVSFIVDGKNRRVGKKLNGTLVKGFLYRDQLGVAAELDGSNQVVSIFLYGTKMNTPDVMLRGGKTYRVISDQVGSVRLVVDSANGAIAQRIDYDEFGRVANDTNVGFQPFGFASGLYDADTGLVRFGARDYDPVLGRWVSKDPILFGGRQGNLYVYVNNDPLNHHDAFGLIVYVCQEHDWSKYWTGYYGFSHAYIRTDANAFGLYPTGAPYFEPAQIVDDYSSEGTCVPVPDVDESCVDNFARFGANWGPYTLGNNCGTFAAEVLSACSPVRGNSGGEGRSGVDEPTFYPPGGY